MKPVDANNASISKDVHKAALDLWHQSGKLTAVQVIGQSMFPIIRHGDQVFVKPGLDDLRRGDIVVFNQGEELMVHRLLNWREVGAKRLFTVKGDNRLQTDPKLTADDLLGKVVAIRRDGRQMSLDTRFWRRLNKLIVAIMLTWITIFDRLSDSDGKRSPGKAKGFKSFLGRTIRFGFSVFLRLVALLLSRWK